MTLSTAPPSSDMPVYRAGTLTYTRIGLVSLFFWLLWGDFCCTLMNSVAPALVPLSLKDAGASNILIAIVTGTIPAIMNMGLNPVISTISDRFRSPYGRRIPFLLWSAPFITFFMILAGFSKPIGLWLHNVALSGTACVSPAAIVLTLTCVFFLCFQFFDLFLNIIYYYLFADVVPEAMMGRFLGLFRMVGQGTGILWSAFVFGLADRYATRIYVCIGLLYLVSFMLMCWKVKEGQYPPPPQRAHGPGFVNSVRSYMEECYGHKFYLAIFAFMVFTQLSWCASRFFIFFARDEILLSLDQFGKVDALCNLITLPFYLIFGWVSDRIHPIRLLFFAVGALTMISFTSYWGIKDITTYIVFSVITGLAGCAFSVALMPLGILLFPKDRYGQFCSAQALMSALFVIGGSFASGWFFDVIGQYRYIFIWKGAFCAFSLLPLLFIYAGWKRYGGKHYVAPLVNISD